jgi:hypothetical protein
MTSLPSTIITPKFVFINSRFSFLAGSHILQPSSSSSRAPTRLHHSLALSEPHQSDSYRESTFPTKDDASGRRKPSANVTPNQSPSILTTALRHRLTITTPFDRLPQPTYPSPAIPKTSMARSASILFFFLVLCLSLQCVFSSSWLSGADKSP